SVLCRGVRADDCLILLPLPVKSSQSPSADLMIVFIGDGSADTLRASGPHVGRKAVFSAAFYTYAAKAGVRQSESRFIRANSKIVWVGGVERSVRAQVQFSLIWTELEFRSDWKERAPAFEWLIEFE